MSTNKLFLLGLATLIGFPFIAFILSFFFIEAPFLSIFNSSYSIFLQIIIGSFLGTLFALGGWYLMTREFIKDELEKYTNLFSYDDLTLPLIVFISFSAGFGEEVFFRGVLQEFFGVVITAIFFVAIHGYINPKNWRISIYGLYMTLVIIVIGVLRDKIGLITAISAHTFIDIVLLLKTKEKLKSRKHFTQEEDFY